MKDDHIVVYYKRKKSGGFDELDYFVWEREFMDKLITHEYVNKNQKSWATGGKLHSENDASLQKERSI
jgi:hypothetical protein